MSNTCDIPLGLIRILISGGLQPHDNTMHINHLSGIKVRIQDYEVQLAISQSVRILSDFIQPSVT